MLEKVFYTSVLVSDQDTALDFYTNVLGLEKRGENPTPNGPRFLTVGVKGVRRLVARSCRLVKLRVHRGRVRDADDRALA